MRRCHTFSRAVRCVSFGVFSLLLILLFSPGAVAQSFYFRAVNLAPGLTALDVHFNDLAQASISGLEFGYGGQVVSYPSSNGKFTVKMTAAGQGLGAAFAGTEVTVQGNREYSGIAYGVEGARKLKVLERSRSQVPLPDKTLVRVFNAIGEGIPIDIHLGTVGSTPLFAGVQPDQATQFLNVPAEATGITITEAGKTVPIAQLTAPLGGTPYVTLIVTGQSRSNIQVYALSDFEQQKTQLVLLEEASYANLRVVHLRPNAGMEDGDKLDIYFNKVTQVDTKVTDTLSYRWASRDFGPIFADSFRVKFVPAGESPSIDVLALDRRLGNDTSYIVVLTEFQDLKPTPLVLTRTPLEPSSGLGSQIRFANASAFYGPITLVLSYGSDSIRFEEVSFKSATDFREIPAGAVVSLKAYRSGSSEPFFTGVQQTIPSGSYYTLLAFGNEQGFMIDGLNESQAGRLPLTSFNPGSSSVPFAEGEGSVPLTGIPNPASENAHLFFSLDKPGQVRIDLYDMMGRNVVSLPQGRYEAGEGEIPLDLSILSPGLYTCVLRSDGGSAGTTKIVVTR